MEDKRFIIPVQQNKTIVPLEDLPQDYRKSLDKGVSTGWRCVDKFMQGLRPGELTVVTADTGVGKTTFTTQLIINVAMQGCGVWINSWEMRPEIMLRKVASLALRKPFKMQHFTDEDSLNFDLWLKKHHIFINPNTIGTDITVLREQLKAAKEQGISIVMLDHLDYLVKSNRDKQHEAIEETIKQLHELVFELRMHIILICHPRQSSNQSEEVGMHNIKGSASIKQYADNIIILHRCARKDKSSELNKVKVHVAKNRMFGFEGCCYLYYQILWDGYLEE